MASKNVFDIAVDVCERLAALLSVSSSVGFDMICVRVFHI